MRAIGIQTSKPIISSDHDHIISFFTYDVETESLPRINTLGASNNVLYVVFAGDPVIKYTFASNTSSEITRLKKLANTHPYVTSVVVSGNEVTLNTDFDKTPTNKFLSIDSSWVSPNADYSISTKATQAIITRFEFDPEGTKVVGSQYCWLDNDTMEINTPTNKLIYSIEDVIVNEAELKAGQTRYIVGNTSITSESKTGIIVVEYTT